MAKLYFRYGAMGSSKTANAIMVYHNYLERGQRALMLKPCLDNRDGEKMVASRSGLHAPCDFVENLETIDLTRYDCIIIDEAQFMTKDQVEYLTHVVDDMNIPVICYGLRADFWRCHRAHAGARHSGHGAGHCGHASCPCALRH